MKTTPTPTRIRRVRRTAVPVPVAGAVAVAVGLGTAMAPPAPAADTALILGPTGVPDPPQSYVDAVENLYLTPDGYGAYTPQVVITPEQGYPITGVNSLSFDASLAQGVSILDSAISQQLAAGNKVVVFGYSQGAAVASQVEARLEASSTPPSPGQLSFVMIGNPSDPNGGINQRFAGLTMPSLGSTFDLAPATSNTYPTISYVQEYDGFADFPQYPLDFLADLNALVGIFTQHFGYADLTPSQLSSAVALPPTDGTTHYYVVPTANLPLLDLVRIVPLIGNPLADLLQPDLRVLINLGYGSITDGWSSDPANVATPFGLVPTHIRLADVLAALATGAVQGVSAALHDLMHPKLFDLSSLSLLFKGLHTIGLTPSDTPTPLQLLAGFAALGNAGMPVSVHGGVLNTLTNVVSNTLAVGLPLVDTAIAIGASIPTYDAQIFTRQIQTGHPLSALLMPIAADLAVIPYAALVGSVLPIVGTLAGDITRLAELTGLQPSPDGGPPAATATTASTRVGPSIDINNRGPLSVAATGSPRKPASTTAALHTTKKLRQLEERVRKCEERGGLGGR